MSTKPENINQATMNQLFGDMVHDEVVFAELAGFACTNTTLIEDVYETFDSASHAHAVYDEISGEYLELCNLDRQDFRLSEVETKHTSTRKVLATKRFTSKRAMDAAYLHIAEVGGILSRGMVEHFTPLFARDRLIRINGMDYSIKYDILTGLPCSGLSSEATYMAAYGYGEDFGKVARHVYDGRKNHKRYAQHPSAEKWQRLLDGLVYVSLF